MKGRYIGASILLVLGAFLTFLVSQFCFDTCPSATNVFIAGVILMGGGFLTGLFFGWLFERRK